MHSGRQISTLADMGEAAVIRALCRKLPAREDVLHGAGDDCAVVRGQGIQTGDVLLTSDPVIEGVHFPHGTSPARIGHKAVGRVLSDIAAMGGRPLWGLVDIVAPPSMAMQSLDELFQGLARLAERHHLAIVGGDTSAGPALQIHVFGVGLAPQGRALLRSTAREGNAVFVTGSLGGSLAGKHLDFEPRVEQGAWLRDWATSMIDVSDGLVTDLLHIADLSGLGAELELSAVPICEAARRIEDGIPPLDHALYDGEDFELLFTVEAERTSEFSRAWSDRFDLRCTRIGMMTTVAGRIEGRSPNGAASPLTAAGYEHFRVRGRNKGHPA